MLNSQETRQRGFTLTELAITIGIIGLILGAIWLAASAVYKKSKYNTFKRHLLELSQNAKSLYGNAHVKSQNNQFATENTHGLFPTDFVANAVDGGNLTTTEGYIANWDVHDIVGATKWYYEIDFTNIPLDSCIQLLLDLAPLNDVYEMYTGGDNWGGNVEGVTTVFPPMTASKAQAACLNTGARAPGYLEIYFLTDPY